MEVLGYPPYYIHCLDYIPVKIPRQWKYSIRMGAQRNLYRYVVQTVYVIRWIPMEVLGLKGSAGAQKLLLLGNPPLAPPLFIQRMGTQLSIEIGSIRCAS